MKDAQAKAIFLKDYRAPEFLIDTTELRFELRDEDTLVHSTLSMRRNPDSDVKHGGLELHGVDLELVSLAIDDETLAEDAYESYGESLLLKSVPDSFHLHCVTRIYPQNNKSLEGLYRSRTMFCTQCEAEGFRKITYYLDRPDVMSVFTTTVEADAKVFPVLLSNGNPVERGTTDDGRHWVKWHDPFPKPAYLFALVAGDLERIDDSFTTESGREISLQLFVEAKDLNKCDHAIDSLKRAMRWDEEVYGREYDLDIFMIVAVDDFNMGAMENKGLNIFNTSCVLANRETTTDMGFQRVEAVVAHEYFHNWSGNRVTCRDWFQLSLKEGFTVFRDAEFSADMGSRTVKRVEDVAILRTIQFAEDAGPMAHPVRPDSFIEISNFYTVTIYEKGSEVVRMLHTLLGAERFRNGSDLYFARHDGQAVTCDDFVAAMETASGRDLGQFRRWYSQAGTPIVMANGHYDVEQQSYTLTLSQSCPPTPGQKEKLPFHIPVSFGLVGEQGDIAFKYLGEQKTEVVLELTEAEQSFVFEDVKAEPVPSLLRSFSAPVRMEYAYSEDDLQFLMRHDSDGFNRWEACQRLAIGVIQRLIKAQHGGAEMVMDPGLIEAYRHVLKDASLDPAMVAKMLLLPSENYLAELADEADVFAIHHAREFVRQQLAVALESEFVAALEANQEVGEFSVDADAIARRSLKNICLAYLMELDNPRYLAGCVEQFEAGHNMTDTMAALTALVNCRHDSACAARDKALAAFYEQWQEEALVVNQWFQVQATCKLPGNLERVQTLAAHPAFDRDNPNKLRSLVGAFCSANPLNFHREDGSGYKFLADYIIELDRKNPQIASRLLSPLTKWKKYPAASSERMREQLQRIMDAGDLSKDVYEVVSKSLA